MGGGWQHDIIRLNARELFEHGSWGIAEASAALPHLEALPQHEDEKADKDMCLHTILALVPDRTKVELVLLNAENGFGLRQLDIGLPKLLIASIVDIRTQQIGALRDRPILFEWPATRLIPEKLFDPPELRFGFVSELCVIPGFIANGAYPASHRLHKRILSRFICFPSRP